MASEMAQDARAEVRELVENLRLENPDIVPDDYDVLSDGKIAWLFEPATREVSEKGFAKLMQARRSADPRNYRARYTGSTAKHDVNYERFDTIVDSDDDK